MADSISINAKACCSQEYKRLMETLKDCDFCSTSYEDHHRCYRIAAQKSGDRARECMHV